MSEGAKADRRDTGSRRGTGPDGTGAGSTPAAPAGYQRCEPCSAAWLAWLDYRLPPAPIVLCSPNRSAREIAASQQRRYQEWRDTIRFEQDLITRLCAAGRHVAVITYLECPGQPCPADWRLALPDDQPDAEDLAALTAHLDDEHDITVPALVILIDGPRETKRSQGKPKDGKKK